MPPGLRAQQFMPAPAKPVAKPTAAVPTAAVPGVSTAGASTPGNSDRDLRLAGVMQRLDELGSRLEMSAAKS